MTDGWIKAYKKMWDNPVVTRDPETFTVWMWLCMHAVFQPTSALFGTEEIILRPGQLITGRKQIAEKTHVNESKVTRILKNLKKGHQIEQQSNSHGSLISIVQWSIYQQTEQQIEQRVNSGRTASEQRSNTKEEYKNIRSIRNKEIYDSVTPENATSLIDQVSTNYSAYCPHLVPLLKMTDKRQRRTIDRLKVFTVEEISKAFKAADASPFLRGEGRDWRAGFDWIMESDERISQLIGGAYRDDSKTSGTWNMKEWLYDEEGQGS